MGFAGQKSRVPFRVNVCQADGYCLSPSTILSGFMRSRIFFLNIFRFDVPLINVGENLHTEHSHFDKSQAPTSHVEWRLRLPISSGSRMKIRRYVACRIDHE